MQDIMKPVECHDMKSNNKADINLILTLYIGYDASIVITNTPPLLVSALDMSAMSKNI